MLTHTRYATTEQRVRHPHRAVTGPCMSSGVWPVVMETPAHLSDALHPVLDVLKGLVISDVIHQDDPLGGQRSEVRGQRSAQAVPERDVCG